MEFTVKDVEKTKKKSPTDWWKEGVIYQIYPRSFMDASGDGTGDLKGITRRLDYLNDGTENSLGVDAIWLSPIFKSPMFDFGYDVSDYSAIDPSFGTMADFDELLKEAHKRNIKIILDFVPNHTSYLHPWFLESKARRDNPKRDWYIWAPPGKGRKGRPNNWQSVFGGPAWEWDDSTSEFFYHHFLKEQPDVNWRNKKLREAMYDQMRFWLDKGVDGFRLDVINHIFKDEALRDNPCRIGRRPYDMQKHLYDKDLPEATLVVHEMREVVDEYSGRMLVGEVYIEEPAGASQYYGDGTDALNLVFYFKFSYMPFKARAFMDAVSLWQKLLPSRAQPTYFLSNHDQPRHIGRYKKGDETETVARAKVAAAMLMTLKGTPFIYYGEEIGMRNLHIKRRDLKDPVGIRYWPIPVGRDMARTPMQWDDSPMAGFTGGKSSWLPINPNFDTINVASESDDPKSLLTFYRRLIWKRKGLSSLRVGRMNIVAGTPNGIFSYIREHRGEKSIVILNFKNMEVDFAPPGTKKGVKGLKVVISTHREEGEIILPGAIKINPYEALILCE